MNYEKLGRFLSFVLRHSPETIGIQLDENGWASVEELIAGVNRNGRKIDMSELEATVAADNKKRYSFSEDKTKIRANQGHSVAVDLRLELKTPPDVLYHGTASRFIDSIMREGLKKQSRNHVHLSADRETAVNVGKRHGSPVVLSVNAKQMYSDGAAFYLSENGVWLTDAVAVQYLSIEVR